MSDFHNAFKAFLATPGSESPKESGGGGSSTPGEESPRPASQPPQRRGRGGGGVVVKAPSPEVEIPTTAIRYVNLFIFFAQAGTPPTLRLVFDTQS
jgi:hypothetical protein